MKFSIIIVAYKGQEALTRLLESLEKHPPADTGHFQEAEIILVDNSPAPLDTPNMKDLLKKYTRFIYDQHPENPGFAEGCNIGARLANGQNLVFINPDTVVFEGWADRLLAHVKPETGAVGPISNFVAGSQQYRLHMQACEAGAWDDTARMAARGMNLRGVDSKMLIGFFLLVPRKVWDKVGEFDPQFFLGCDDLDYSLRIRDAGYTLIVATDVFVYHEGHVTFNENPASLALNKQSEKRLLAKLKAKYPDGIPTATELWGLEMVPTMPQERQTLSVCLIVRDEDKNLDELIPQLGFADEVIIVDTSHDGRPGTQWGGFYEGPNRSGGACLQDWKHKPVVSNWYWYRWDGSFANARNYALSKCTSDWVLSLDADERLSLKSQQLIRAAMDNPGPLTAEKKCYFALKIIDHGSQGRIHTANLPRLFPRLPGLVWEFPVHETFAGNADRMGLKIVITDIEFEHTGYQDAEKLKVKSAKYLKILETMPDSPHKFYHIAKTYQILGDQEKSAVWYGDLLEEKWAEPLNADFVHHIGYLIALLLYQSHGKAVPEMDKWLEGNEKPDAVFLRAERAFERAKVDDKTWKSQELAEAKGLYTAYANAAPIMDCYGCDQDAFTAASLTRLDIIERIMA